MKRPNILFIMADQMAAPILPLHRGDSPILMPHLSALAAAGTVFDSAYCNSPLCAPSRFSLVPGQLPSRIGAYDNAADLAAAAGLAAAAVAPHARGAVRLHDRHAAGGLDDPEPAGRPDPLVRPAAAHAGAVAAVAVPLREAAAGGGAEQGDAHARASKTVAAPPGPQAPRRRRSARLRPPLPLAAP